VALYARNTQHTKEIRQKVLETAKELLIEQGYKKTTIRGIVERSGVLTGSIYYFFKNKEMIFADMIATIVHQCIEKIDACSEGESPAFKYAVICEVELKKMQDDPRIREIYYECYHSPIIFERMVDLFAAYAEQLFGERFTTEEYRQKNLLIKGAMGACITAMNFETAMNTEKARREVIRAALKLFGISEAEIEATLQHMAEREEIWQKIAQELVEMPLAI
jgi:AcrR family transcriptional regulator